MKKFILLIMVSVFFNSVPGYTSNDREKAEKKMEDDLAPAAEPTRDPETEQMDPETEQMVLQAGAFATRVSDLLRGQVTVLEDGGSEELDCEVAAFRYCIDYRHSYNPAAYLGRDQGGTTKRDLDEEERVMQGRLENIDRYLKGIKRTFANEVKMAKRHLETLLQEVRSSGISLPQTREEALDLASEEASAAVTSVETPAADSREAELQALHDRIVTAEERSREAELKALCDQIITANRDGELLHLEAIFDISKKVAIERAEHFAKMEIAIGRMYPQAIEHLQRVMDLLPQGTEEIEQAMGAVLTQGEEEDEQAFRAVACYGAVFKKGAAQYASVQELWGCCNVILGTFQASTEEMMEQCSSDMATMTSLQRDLEEDKTIQSCSIPKAAAEEQEDDVPAPTSPRAHGDGTKEPAEPEAAE